MSGGYRRVARLHFLPVCHQYFYSWRLIRSENCVNLISLNCCQLHIYSQLFKNLFEEGLKIQRSRLNDLRRYARDKRSEQQLRQRNEIASLENYYKDQFAILAETLETERKDLKTRNDAQSKVIYPTRALSNTYRVSQK